MNAAEQAAEQGFSASQGTNLSKKLVALTTGSATQEESEDKNGSRLVAPCIWAEPLISISQSEFSRRQNVYCPDVEQAAEQGFQGSKTKFFSMSRA